ncbi:MAG: NYN domain-containing protein [Spirochaetia bacterium]|nr:NYN domain-containing protein [Spirochaetia bacterium]
MKKAFIAVDGIFGFDLFQHGKEQYHKVLDFGGLIQDVCQRLGTKGDCQVLVPKVLRRCYIGATTKCWNPVRREYETALRNAKFVMPGRPLCSNGKEKGIDTLLFSEVIEAARYDYFDYLVLLTGDLDHITLVQDLKEMGKETILLTGKVCGEDGLEKTGYSKELENNCMETIDIFSLIGEPKVFKDVPAIPAVAADKKQIPQVVQAIVEIMAEKSKEVGKTAVFAYQDMVEARLVQNGTQLGMPLGEYLVSFPTIFKVGCVWFSQRKTVSLINTTNTLKEVI